MYPRNPEPRHNRYRYDNLGRISTDQIAGLERSYRYDEFARLRDVTAPHPTKKNQSIFMERITYRTARGNALAAERQLRSARTEPLTLEQYHYGNGMRTGIDAGARGRLARTVARETFKSESRLTSEATHTYLTNGQLAATTSTSFAKFDKVVTRRVAGRLVRRTIKVNRASFRQSEAMHLDVQGRRIGVSSSTQNVASGLGIQRNATRYEYELDADDPMSEYSTRPEDPDVRVIVPSHAGGNLGEVRDTKARYQLEDQRGSIRSVMNGSSVPEVHATFDYDTWGKPKTDTAVASGRELQRLQQAFGFTGMRNNHVGPITHHHARDYNASTRAWLTTDQYTDPWRDRALSLDPMNRNRSQYAAGNPITFTDPNGHEICVWKFCTKLDERIAEKVDRLKNTVRVVAGRTPQRVVRRSILPTGSVGPITISSPSVVNVSSQLDPYPGVSNDDMANRHMDAGHVLDGAEAIFRTGGAVYAGKAWDSAKYVSRGVPRKAPILMGRANLLNRLATASGMGSIGYTLGSECIGGNSTADCTVGGPVIVGAGALGWRATAGIAAKTCPRSNPRSGAICFVALTSGGAFVGGETASRMVDMMALSEPSAAVATLPGSRAGCNGGDLWACVEHGWAIGTAING